MFKCGMLLSPCLSKFGCRIQNMEMYGVLRRGICRRIVREFDVKTEVDLPKLKMETIVIIYAEHEKKVSMRA